MNGGQCGGVGKGGNEQLSELCKETEYWEM